MWRKCVLLLIFSISLASGREIVIRPTSVVSGFDQWGQVGSGTKIQKITDAVDANRIVSLIVADTDIFEYGDIMLDTGERIDSLVRFTRAGLVLAVSGTLQNALIIGSDSLAAPAITLAGGFANYQSIFPTAPGTRGEWDDAEVDSIRGRYHLSAVGVDSAQITSDSIVVYITQHLSSAGGAKVAGFATLFGKCNNAVQKTVSTTVIPLDTGNVRIPAASLVNTNKYIIFYGAAIGGRTVSHSPEFMCFYSRGDTLGHVVYQTGSTAGHFPAGGGKAQGFAFITANGTDSIYDNWRNRTAADTVYASGHCLISVDLTNQTENIDYYLAQTNFSDAAVMTDTNNTNTSDTTLIAGTFTTASGDHLVLMAGEYQPTGGTQNGGSTLYAYIDGAVRKKTGKLTFEHADDWGGFMYAEVINFSAASHTFAIRGGNRDNNTSDVPMRRGKILVLDLANWPDKSYTQIATDSVVNNVYSAWENYLETAITPSTSQDVLVIGNAYNRNTAGTSPEVAVLSRIRNITDAIAQSDVSTSMSRDDEDTLTNTSYGFLAAWGTTSKTFGLQNCKTPLSNTDAMSDGTLIVLGMKEDVAAPPAATNRRKIRLEKSGLIGYGVPEQPFKLVKQVLGLPPCDCEE